MKEKTVGSARELCHAFAKRGASPDVTNTLAERLPGQGNTSQAMDAVFAASSRATGFARTLTDTYCGLKHGDADWRIGAMFCTSEPKPQFASRAS